MSANEKINEYQHKPLPQKVTLIGLVILIIGILWSGAAFFTNPLRAEFNYLIAFTFLVSIALGSLFWVAIEYIAGADWSTPVRRVPEFLASLLWIVALGAVPLIIFSHDLYHWMHKEAVMGDHILEGKMAYLNETFFIVRTVIVIAIWLIFYYLITRNSQKQDEDGSQKRTAINIRLSAAFLVLFALSITVASVDWMMSLDPHWFSTIFGVYYFSGTVMAGISAVALATVLLKENGYLHPHMPRDSYYSMGTLMFAFNIFWAYIAFSQYMLIWYGNLPEETFWFIDRMKNGWGTVAWGLIIFHFLIPFLLMLPRSIKTNPLQLKIWSVWLLLAHYYDLYFVIMPAYSKESVTLGWMEFGFPLIPVGLAIVFFAWQAKKKNLVPVKDPKLERGLHFHL
jgi:ABC-type uncharacterized transport system permease subunit